MATKPTYATGRRKTSSARVYLSPRPEEETGETLMMVVNGRPFESYFPRPTTQMLLKKPFELTERITKYSVVVSVSGGGSTGQAGAVLHGVARALQTLEPELRGPLKKAGLLTRDPRAVERKKPGKRKARKSTQYSKR